MDHVEAPVIAGLELPADDSFIIVAGAYKGDTIAFIRHHFPYSFILGYEPQEWAVDVCLERFRDDERIHIYPFALGINNNEAALMYEYETDACSLVPRENSRKHGTCTVLDANMQLPRSIQLFIMNIEGYEFSLIPYLITECIYIDIEKLLVQYHGPSSEMSELMVRSEYNEKIVGANWCLYER